MLITVIAFCSTSVPEPSQKFEQPQYLLFKSTIIDLKNESFKYNNNHRIHKIDSSIIYSIDYIDILSRPTLNDEFHKTMILNDLDLLLIREIKGDQHSNSDLSKYIEIRDSSIIYGDISISLKIDSFIDHLNFKNSRLNGNFKRLSNNNQLIINGAYRNGIEDSIWTYYNQNNQIITTKEFKNGELVKSNKYNDSTLRV